MLPPGRARLATSPSPTGSCTSAHTIGIEVVAFLSETIDGVPLARIASGFDATSSAAWRSTLAA
jgi:hypothetical protein